MLSVNCDGEKTFFNEGINFFEWILDLCILLSVLTVEDG